MMGSQPADSTDRRAVAVTIEAQRRRLFRASAVAEMCRLACASKYDDFDPEQLAEALWVVFELIDDAAGALEKFAGNEATRQRDDDSPDPRLVAESLRKDAALLLQQHPQLQTVHAQLLRAAAVIEGLAANATDDGDED